MAITRLSPTTVARIAAGEVVERPASIVKELVENAIDAGARRVTVNVEGGGVDLIRVADDGHGMGPEDLMMAFERHATSKLPTDGDLEAIATLGFRGEALPSIAAVADVDCVSRREGDPHAWSIVLRGGVPEAPRPDTLARGTIVLVRGVFSELPARRKFLRGRSSETGLIVATCSQLALAYPEIAFHLTTDGKDALRTLGDGELRRVVGVVHGRQIADAMVPLDGEVAEGASVSGLITDGSATLPTRAGISILVNRRPVQSRALSYAVEEAYRTSLPVGRHPIVVLDVRVPPAEVDVNVHPRKLEVRLLNERQVFGMVQRAISRCLGRAGRSALLGPDAKTDSNGRPSTEDWASGLRILGQASATYIIAEGRSGLYLVDQHAAHERVLYEALRGSYRAGSARQPLLEPAPLELPAAVLAAVRDHLGEANGLGYDVEPFGDQTLLVRAVPAALADRDPLGTLAAALSELAEESPPADWRDRLAALFACHNAIRAGDRLTEPEMLALLDQLGEARLCQVCSHGRPTAILLTHSQLARQFGRGT